MHDTSQSELPTSERVTSGPVGPGHLAVIRWLVLIAAAFGILALGLRWLSRSVTIASPLSETATDVVNASQQDDDRPDYPAPDFRLASLDGGEIGPGDYPGEVVVVELWATWCGPCRLQARFLEELHAELDGKGVRFLAVSVGEQEATVREFVESKPFPYPVLLDPRDTLGQRYRVIGLPTIMIIDRQGIISFLEAGIADVAKLRYELEIAGAGLS